MNGKEAVEIAKKHRPDLILMDLRMPELNGYEATKIIKSLKSTQDIPVIALSASPKIILNQNSQRDIFDDFIMKPVNLAELSELMAKYIRREEVVRGEAEGKGKKVKTARQLTKRGMQRHLELIEILDRKLLPESRELLTKQMISEIDRFGQDLVTLGKKAGCDLLVAYGDEICSNVESFDVEIMMEKLRFFPEIIKRIKNITKE